jgi:hypothetical protein
VEREEMPALQVVLGQAFDDAWLHVRPLQSILLPSSVSHIYADCKHKHTNGR